MGDRDAPGDSDVRAGLRAAHRAVLARLALLDRLHREAAGCVYCGDSAERAVAASVDGNGRLLTLEIDPAALRFGHPERVGPQVVAAVAAARAAAADAKAGRMRRAFDSVDPEGSVRP